MIRIFFAVLLCIFFCPSTYAAQPIEAYGHLPSVETMRISPTGKRYAFIAVIGDARRLIAVSDKGETLLATQIGDVKVRNIEWAGDDHILVWSTITYDNRLELDNVYEFLSVTNIDLKARKVSSVFSKAKNISQFVFGYAGTFKANGHDSACFAGLTFDLNRLENVYEFVNDHRDLYCVDLDGGDVTRAARGGDGPAYSWVVSNEGEIIAHSIYNYQDGKWRLYAGKENVKLLLEKSTPFGDVGLIGRGRAPDTVWVTDSSSGTPVVEEISITDGKRETIFSDVTPDDFLIDPVSRLGIGATTLEQPNAIFFDDKLEARLKATRKAFPNLQMELISFSQNLDRLIVKTSGSGDSGTFWLVNIATGQADPLGYPYPEIHAADVGPTQIFNYTAKDGLEIDAVLTLPPRRKSENLPLVVLPHGGPIGVNDAVHFDWWAQAYASLGYAVLQPNYRGSAGKGGDFVMAGYGQWGRKMQTDLSDGVAALAAQGIVNPKRVCIVGASYGGYAALAGVTLQHDIYRCAVSVGGPSNLSAFFQWRKNRNGHGESDATRYWRAVTGADKEGDAVMKELSPSYLAEKANAPILLIHGKDDTVVPIEQSRLMESALRSANKPVEFIEMPGEDHWLSREETRQTMLKASVDFVRKYNPPD